MQDNLHIVHNDVHFNNLSVQEMSYTNEYDRFTYYRTDNKVYKINTYKHGLIKLYDFDLACMYDMKIGNGDNVSVINHNLQELSDGFPYYPQIYDDEKINTPFYMFDFLWLLYNLIYEVNIDSNAVLTKYLIQRYLVPYLSYRMIWKNEVCETSPNTPEYVEYVRSHPNCELEHIRFSQIKRRNIKWMCSMVENSPFRYNRKMLLPNRMKIFTDFSIPDELRGLKVSEIMKDEHVHNAIKKFECNEISELNQQIKVFDI